MMTWLVLPIAFCCEFVDQYLGMGFGTILAPVLLLMGFKPMEVVPIILLEEVISGMTGVFFHHRNGNCDMSPSQRPFKIATRITIFTVVGTVAGVVAFINIAQSALTGLIAVIVLAMGVIILWNRKNQFEYSKARIYTVSTIASFNKGISGGGYGPLMMGGNILSGVKTKEAIAIVCFAEAVCCALGFTLYAFSKSIVWTLAPYILVGGFLAVPVGARLVRQTDETKLKTMAGVMILILGTILLFKTLLK